MNILSIDLEEWFQLFTPPNEAWEAYETRIYKNTEVLLSMLEEADIRASFFVVGWVAKKYPDLVREIANRYEVGAHSMNHIRVGELGREGFRKDTEEAIKTIEDIIGEKVRMYRAPGFSIDKNRLWAFDIIMENGIEIDSSLVVDKRKLGFESKKPFIISSNGMEIREMPIIPKRLLGFSSIFSGGGYFRFFPYSLIKKWSKALDYNMHYIHPRDLDCSQPRLKDVSLLQRFRSYYGLSGAKTKLINLINDFDLIDIAEAERRIDWTEVKRVELGVINTYNIV